MRSRSTARWDADALAGPKHPRRVRRAHGGDRSLGGCERRGPCRPVRWDRSAAGRRPVVRFDDMGQAAAPPTAIHAAGRNDADTHLAAAVHDRGRAAQLCNLHKRTKAWERTENGGRLGRASPPHGHRHARTLPAARVRAPRAGTRTPASKVSSADILFLRCRRRAVPRGDSEEFARGRPTARDADRWLCGSLHGVFLGAHRTVARNARDRIVRYHAGSQPAAGNSLTVASGCQDRSENYVNCCSLALTDASEPQARIS